MKLIYLILFLICQGGFAQDLSRNPVETIKVYGDAIKSTTVEGLPVQDRGRIKPFHTFARETILFLSGKYSFFDLNATQLYLAMIVSPDSERMEFINLRDTTLRVQLGFPKGKRYFSHNELEKSPLLSLAEPLREKQEMNSRSLSPEEKNIMEAYNQFWFFKQVRSGEHFLHAIDFSSLEKSPMAGAGHGEATETLEMGKLYLNAIQSLDRNQIANVGKNLVALAKNQKAPELFKPQLEKLNTEVIYNKARLFFVAAILFLLIGIAFFSSKFQRSVGHWANSVLLAVPILILGIGFAIRVYITGFAPVTNMYGTMVWVSFGIAIFSLLLLKLYKNFILIGCLWIGCSVVLLLTESIPIILSPDLDPIVAVLRSNLWLTIHVLTIVISYAAFTITMILSNVMLVRSIIYRIYDDEVVRSFSQSIYRMTQLGVFLITIGIILGGVWADYSWGRFWGWDPKETWALIADLGYIAILHARIVGWLPAFGVILASPVAYLLVIMAWYGVNFILAAGLHSYGFSSGGAAVVLTFVIIQMGILVTAAVLKASYKKQAI